MESIAILRRSQVQAASGLGKATMYARISHGLWPQPVRIGPRAVGWPAAEVAAINAARIRGASDDDIRGLVKRLEIARTLCGEGSAA